MTRITITGIAGLLIATVLALIYFQYKTFSTGRKSMQYYYSARIRDIYGQAWVQAILPRIDTIDSALHKASLEAGIAKRASYRGPATKVYVAGNSKYVAEADNLPQEPGSSEHIQLYMMKRPDAMLLVKTFEDIITHNAGGQVQPLEQVFKMQLSQAGIDTGIRFITHVRQLAIRDGQAEYADTNMALHSEERPFISSHYRMQGKHFEVITQEDIVWPNQSQWIVAAYRPLFMAITATSVILLAIAIYIIWALNRQKKLSDLQRDFIANTNHELKTPLASVTIAVKSLHETALAKNDLESSMLTTAIMSQAERIRQLFDHSLSRAFMPSPAMQHATDVYAEIHAAMTNVQLAYPQLMAVVHTNFNAHSHHLLIPPGTITTIFTNILDNAYKYADPQQESEIFIDAYNKQSFLILTITAAGNGFPANDRSRIFRKGYRGINSAGIQGSGLGMYQVKQLVKLYRGKIKVQCNETNVRFVMQFPVHA